MKHPTPVTRDPEAELEAGLGFEGLAAYWNDETDTLHLLGIVITEDGTPIDEYREVHLVAMGKDGTIVARDYVNWGEFGRKRSFAFTISEDDIFARPTTVQVFPTR